MLRADAQELQANPTFSTFIQVVFDARFLREKSFSAFSSGQTTL
jgi:hypothetical protein